MRGDDRLRHLVATVLVVIGSAGLVIASTGWWLERSLLDTGRFTGTANAILDRSEVQDELTTVLVQRLSHAAGTDLAVAQPFLSGVVTQVVDSGPFRSVFDRAVSSAHHVIVDKDTGTIILDLTGAYDQIKAPLEQVAPKLAAQLPSRRRLEVQLLQRTQLTTAWDVIGDVKRAVRIITVASVALVAAGIALARERWRAGALAAWVALGGLAVLALSLVVGRVVLKAQIHDAGVAGAVGAAYSVITRSLLVQSVVLGVVVLAVALAARFTQRHGREAWAPAVRGWWTWLQGALPGAPEGRDVVSGTAAALTPVRLPAPRVESRAAHGWRAVALLVVGLFAVFDPRAVTTVLVVGAGIGALYLAVTEAIAATAATTSPHIEAQ